jgi:hypothetical protein
VLTCAALRYITPYEFPTRFCKGCAIRVNHGPKTSLEDGKLLYLLPYDIRQNGLLSMD